MIVGHPRSAGYFVKFRNDLLRGELQFHPYLLSQAKKFLKKVKSKHKKAVKGKPYTMVGIHVRRLLK